MATAMPFAASIPIRAQIGFAWLFSQQLRLGRLHRAHDRGVAALIAVYAHADVDFPGSRIGPVRGDQGKQGVGLLLWQAGERNRMQAHAVAFMVRSRSKARRSLIAYSASVREARSCGSVRSGAASGGCSSLFAMMRR